MRDDPASDHRCRFDRRAARALVALAVGFGGRDRLAMA
jgi:hypothetical protein